MELVNALSELRHWLALREGLSDISFSRHCICTLRKRFGVARGQYEITVKAATVSFLFSLPPF
jgi:hypothetical protein